MNLTDEDRRWLAQYARDQQEPIAPTPTLARLERLGLLMRAWSNRYVVTAKGHEALGSPATPDSP